MLEKLFVSILNMSLIGSYVIIFVLIARLLLKKAPKIFSYALWSIVLFRLICPFSFESVLSLIPMAKTPIPQDIIYSTLPQINTGINIIDNSINPILPAPNLGDSVNPLQIWIFIGTIIWVLGMLAMLIYSVISFAKLRKRLIGSVQMKDNIYLADHISSPFVMGIIKPKIYLPSSLSDSEKDFIIAHEMCHTRRLDHITRILGFVALAIHWFNPLVWASFILSGKDMELSCDETVMKKMNVDIRIEYSQSLLRFATGKKMFHATPLAFGEGDTKGRIKNVLNYKKPAFWVIVVSAIAIIAIGVGLMTNSSNKPIISPYVQEYIPGQGNIRGNVDIESYEKISPDFAVGAEKYGVAVFKNPHKAFETFEQLYAEGIAYIQKSNNLRPLSQNYYNAYKTYGWQMTGGTKEELSQAEFVSGFLDIYENSFLKQYPNTNSAEPTVEAVSPLDYFIMTDEIGAIGCEYSVNKDNQLDTLQMLSALEKLNGFKFDTDWASHGYI
ncbi:MAG: M56 family metallopeptidase, partial [Christensenellaceae bacterium]